MAVIAKVKKSADKPSTKGKPAKAKQPEIAHIREYKGNKLFAVGDPEAEFASLQIGMRKLKLIVANLEAAKAFIKSNGESVE